MDLNIYSLDCSTGVVVELVALFSCRNNLQWISTCVHHQHFYWCAYTSFSLNTWNLKLSAKLKSAHGLIISHKRAGYIVP
jgi:hypothetical protein